MANNFSSFSDAKLANDSNVLNTFLKPVGIQTKYGISAAQSAALNTSSGAFAADLTDITVKQDALKTAVQVKNTERANLLSTVKEIQGIILNKPGLTSADIIAAGFVPHDNNPTTVVPVMPTNFNAAAFANGAVTLSWKRSGNKPSVTFVIETTANDGQWSVVAICTKTKITLDGYTPGVPASFRVVAVRGALQSLPSNVAVIYSAGGDSMLQIAA